MLKDDPQYVEALEFMEKLKGFIELIQPEGYEEFLNFCDQVVPTIVDACEEADRLEDVVYDKDMEIASLARDIDDLEYSTGQLTSEIENLKCSIIWLEHSKGTSRY